MGFLNIWKRIFSFQPLTVRGLLAVVLSVLALRLFAYPESDLVANIIGGGILGLCTVTILSSTIFRISLARKLAIEVTFDRRAPLSNQLISAGMVLRNSTIPPFFSLEVTRKFRNQGVQSKRHLLKGRSTGPRHLTDTITFPHRGLWILETISFSLRDALGFTKLSWSTPISSSLEVSAPTIPIRPLPIVASSSRSGETLHEARERSGDMFDIKAYSPSDGVKRILWKTYAKSEQLVVRRPEPAVLPEGEIAIYLVANKKEDYVAGALQSYLQQLVDLDIIVIFGTDGFSSSAQGAPTLFTSQPEETKHAINRSVWSKDAGTANGFNAYLQALAEANRRIHQVVVFAPERGDGWFETLRDAASSHHVGLSLALVPKRLDVSNSHRTDVRKSDILNRLKKRNAPNDKNTTIPVIVSSGAQILLCESVEGYEKLNESRSL